MKPPSDHVVSQAAPRRYSESLFAALTMAGLCCLYCPPWGGDSGPARQDNRATLSVALACAAFTLSAGVRSNGVVNGGYLLHALLEACWRDWRSSGRALPAAVRLVLGTGTALTCVAAPMALHQLQGYRAFCQPAHNSGVDGPGRPYCNDAIPRIYSFVQRHYWGVGFLEYWRLNQVGCMMGSNGL